MVARSIVCSIRVRKWDPLSAKMGRRRVMGDRMSDQPRNSSNGPHRSFVEATTSVIQSTCRQPVYKIDSASSKRK